MPLSNGLEDYSMGESINSASKIGSPGIALEGGRFGGMGCAEHAPYPQNQTRMEKFFPNIPFLEKHSLFDRDQSLRN